MVKKCYGDEFDAGCYFERFFDDIIVLPRENRKSFYMSTGLNNSSYTYDIVCTTMVETFDFRVREQIKFSGSIKEIYEGANIIGNITVIKRYLNSECLKT